MLRVFPHHKNDNQRVYNIHEEAIVNEISKSVPRIDATIENWQVDHRASVVELEEIITE